MGKLAVVIARGSIFGKVLMATSSVGGEDAGGLSFTDRGARENTPSDLFPLPHIPQ